MKSIEDLLNQMPLRAPSRDLDRRIEAVVSPGNERRRWKHVAVWSHVLTAAACLLLGVLVGRFGANDAGPSEFVSFMDQPGRYDSLDRRILQPVSAGSDDVNTAVDNDIDPQTHFVEYRYRQCIACHEYSEDSSATQARASVL